MSEKIVKLSGLIYILPILWCIVIRCSTGLYSYSGENKPPLRGDFEAQRHWMEITVNLPIESWYQNSTLNNLQYWGLDYPPLTAYHSYFLGKLTQTINSSWVELVQSQGIEHPTLKYLMRTFVVLSDILLYLPAIALYYYYISPKILNRIVDFNVMTCGYFYSGIILIDHGHFQYNNVSLGLYLLACISFLQNYDSIGSIIFCLALSYKQMELYHALPIFILLLGKSLQTRSLSYFIKIALSVICTFTAIFIPLIYSYKSYVEPIKDVLHRIFPIARGIYEDKVSNFWCTISPIFKFNELSRAVLICASSTLLASLPALLYLFANIRNKDKFLLTSLIVSLNFFLFSFQVHEKSILLVAVCALLTAPIEKFWSNSFLYFTTPSMLPLLYKDGLIVPTLCCSVIFLICFIPIFIESGRIQKLMFLLFNLGYINILALYIFVQPPLKYPFLYSLFTSQWSCFIFIVHQVVFHKALFK